MSQSASNHSEAAPSTVSAASTAASKPTASASASGDDAPIDLTALLSSLSRDDLELLLVHAISRYPALYRRLVALLSRPVDTAGLASSLGSLLSFAAQPSSLTPELEPHVEQAGDYVRCGRVRGGVEVLGCVSDAVVGWVRQLRRGRESSVDDEYNNLESFFGLLESAWSDALAAIAVSDSSAASIPAPTAPRPPPLYPGAASFTVRELKQLANRMTQWQQALASSMGPLFSDPLRALKRIIKQAEDGGAGSDGTSEKSGQEKQRADKRQRASDERAGEQQGGGGGKRAKEKQLASGGGEMEQKSDAG